MPDVRAREAAPPALERAELTFGPVLHQGSLGVLRFASHAGAARKRLLVRELVAPSTRDPELLPLVSREAELGSHTQCQYFVRRWAVRCTNGASLSAMEHVDGPTLSTLLAARGQANPRLLMPAVVDMLRALGVLHALADEAGPLEVVHQAPVPRHVVVGHDGIARLIDLTRAVSRRHPWSQRLSELLRPCELSPDQLLAPARVDARSDVFAAGVTLWHVLTGQPLFDPNDGDVAIRQILRAPLPALSEGLAGVGFRLDRLVSAMLSRTRADRPGSALELADELEVEAARSGLLASREELGMHVRSVHHPSIRSGAPPGALGVHGHKRGRFAATLVGMPLDEPVRAQLKLALHRERVESPSVVADPGEMESPRTDEAPAGFPRRNLPYSTRYAIHAERRSIGNRAAASGENEREATTQWQPSPLMGAAGAEPAARVYRTARVSESAEPTSIMRAQRLAQGGAFEERRGSWQRLAGLSQWARSAATVALVLSVSGAAAWAVHVRRQGAATPSNVGSVAAPLAAGSGGAIGPRASSTTQLEHGAARDDLLKHWQRELDALRVVPDESRSGLREAHAPPASVHKASALGSKPQRSSSVPGTGKEPALPANPY